MKIVAAVAVVVIVTRIARVAMIKMKLRLKNKFVHMYIAQRNLCET